MGRKSSLKNYDEKLLVVVNPWPSSGPHHHQFVNNVASWFEIMLGNKGTVKVDAIYQQKTHHHIIVELPAETKVEHLIGAHHWDDFLSDPFKPRQQGKVSYIYEYNYEVFRHPSQINWYASVPTYTVIDPSFPITLPYPSPRPAPAARVPYAAALPPQLRLGMKDNNIPPSESTSGSAIKSSLTESAFCNMDNRALLESDCISRPELASNGNDNKKDDVTGTCAHVKLEKIDPYEEEEDAKKRLQMHENKFRETRVEIKADPDNYEPYGEEDVKKWLHVSSPAETDNRNKNNKLHGPRVEIKADPDIYEPSQDLVSLISQRFPDHAVGAERDAKIKGEENYYPSKALQVAITDYIATGHGRREDERGSLDGRSRTKQKQSDTCDLPLAKKVKREHPL